MLAIAPTEHEMVRTPGAAPGTSGWMPDALLLRHARAEGRRHDHHTVSSAASLAGSASASLVDLPWIGLDGRTLTSSLSDRSRPLCTVELRRDVGAPAMTRTSTARLEDGSLSCRQAEAMDTRAGVEPACGVLQTLA